VSGFSGRTLLNGVYQWERESLGLKAALLVPSIEATLRIEALITGVLTQPEGRVGLEVIVGVLISTPMQRGSGL
jgi:hypothetical protein